MESLWPHGFIDVQAVEGGKRGAEKVRGYLFKDLLKQSRADVGTGVISQANYTLAMNWFFGKRSFAVSGKAVAADLITTVHNSNRRKEKVPVLDVEEGKKLTFCGVVRLDLQGEAPFFMVLPGSLVREDDRFKVLRDLLECKRPIIKPEPLPDWSGWNDARAVPIADKLLRAIEESKQLLRDALPERVEVEVFGDIVDEQLCALNFERLKKLRKDMRGVRSGKF
jgi:hypothetical protein